MTKIFGSLKATTLLVYGIILIVLLCTIAFAKEELKIGMDAPDFALQDAEDKNYKLKEMKGDVVILIMGNSKTRKETDKWAKAIKKDYSKYEELPSERKKKSALGRSEGLKIFMIADMRSVPRFVPRGFIKGWLKMNKPPATLLLDWDGKTHIAYKPNSCEFGYTQKRKPTVFIISKVGKIAYRIDANYNDKTYKKVKTEIKRNLEENILINDE
ncbi:TPA: redoxin domain-containing protein [Candidatus Poribacteria bacterium]|nr:redoxin domain-containing protein [Candidatus Poribacteria bacterium]